MASRYDDEIWELVPGAEPPGHIARFVRGLGPAGAVLDLGCGDGRLAALLEADERTLADVSPVALARARERLPAARAVELEPDAPLPLPDGAFDLVLCAETIEHVRDVQLLLSEARRVLRPGGRLALTTPAHGRLAGLRVLAGGFERQFDPLSPHIRFLSRRSLRALLDAMGFDVGELRRESGTLLAVASEVRVLIDTTYADRGPSGTGVYIEMITAALRRAGTVEVVEARQRMRLRPGAGNPLRSAANGALDLLWLHVGLPRAARIAGADVVHHPLPAYSRRIPAPQVVTVHDLAFVRLPRPLRPRLARSSPGAPTGARHAAAPS